MAPPILILRRRGPWPRTARSGRLVHGRARKQGVGTGVQALVVMLMVMSDVSVGGQGGDSVLLEGPGARRRHGLRNLLNPHRGCQDLTLGSEGRRRCQSPMTSGRSSVPAGGGRRVGGGDSHSSSAANATLSRLRYRHHCWRRQAACLCMKKGD